jgi:isoleucyl-tRNA synthetase
LPVRQPVSTATGPSFSSGYEDIIREEVNVKKYITSEVIEINTDITPELKQEGNHNELVRAIQDMRKKMGLMPSDTISLTVRTDKAGEDLINKFKKELLKVVGAREVKFTENNGTEIKIGDLSFVINISK